MLLKAWIPNHHDSVPGAPAVLGYGCVRSGDVLHCAVLAVHDTTRAKTLRAQLWSATNQKPQRIRIVWTQLKPGEHRNVTLKIGGNSATQT